MVSWIESWNDCWNYSQTESKSVELVSVGPGVAKTSSTKVEIGNSPHNNHKTSFWSFFKYFEDRPTDQIDS